MLLALSFFGLKSRFIMAKRTYTSPAPAGLAISQQDKHVLVRIVLLCSVLLGLTLAILHYLLAGWTSGSFLNGLRIGAGLLTFWLFVTSAVRGLHRLRPRINTYWLVICGLGTAVLGTLAFLFSVRIYAMMAHKSGVLPSYSIIGFYTLAGLLASLISLIRLRVKDRATGNVLEAVLLVGAVFVFFWITR
jgi:hypothetical protein